MRDHGRVAGGAEVGFSGCDKQARNKFAQGGSDPDALKVGQADGAVFAPARPYRVREREDGTERRGTIFESGQEALGGSVQGVRQIMMTLE